MGNKAKLTYFKFHGLGEPVRFMLAYTGVEWDENLIDLEDFPNMKDKLPYGKLPLLEIDGLLLHQSAAIIRYLARRAGGLYGITEMDALKCDVAYDTISDFRMLLLGFFYEPNEVSKAEKKKHVLETLVPMYMRNLEEHVIKNNGYFVNGRLTWVDIVYGGLIDYLSHMAERDLVEEKPNLKKLKENVHNLPEIKEYMGKRRKFVY